MIKLCVKCGAFMTVGTRQCHDCKKQYWRDWYSAHRRDPESIAKRRKREQDGRHTDPRRSMLANARQRAKHFLVPFNLALEDIVIPATCPILAIPLKIAAGTPTDNSPSLDRIRPLGGYVRGNVAVISFRANQIKNCATSVELRAIADWLDKQ